jgi:hypothetical protein
MQMAGESERVVRESQDVNRAYVLQLNDMLYEITVKLLVCVCVYIYIYKTC